MTRETAPTVGLLLAAGSGSRFDRSGRRNKLLADLAGRPVVEHSAQKLLDALGVVIAVVRPDTPEVHERLRALGCDVVVCEQAHAGMGHSLACGVTSIVERHRPGAILVALGDMPNVRPATISSLLALAGPPECIAAPRHAGRRGHPVLFGSAHFEALRASRGDQGAGKLLAMQPVRLIDVDDSGVLLDVDTPEDLDATFRS